MKVAIIGANGQLGTDLVKVFGDIAIPLTRKELDVTDKDTLKILEEFKPDVVINTAAYVRVDDAEDEADKAFQVNAVGALNVGRITNKINAINVYISTDYVFDGSKDTPYTENDIPNPINVYGASKYAGEILTKCSCNKYYIIRVSSLFGVAGASGKGGNFVETMIKKGEAGKELNVVNDIKMTPTYTKDAAIAIKKIVEKNLPYGLYHVTNDGVCSWYDFAKAIFEMLGMDVKLNPITSDKFPTKAIRPRNSSLSIKKLRSFGIDIRHWKEGLKDYLLEKGHLDQS